MLFSERRTGKKRQGDLTTLIKLCNNPFQVLHRTVPGYYAGEYRYNHEYMKHYFLLRTKDARLSPLEFGTGIKNLDDLFDMLECAYAFLKEQDTSYEKPSD